MLAQSNHRIDPKLDIKQYDFKFLLEVIDLKYNLKEKTYCGYCYSVYTPTLLDQLAFSWKIVGEDVQSQT